VNTIIVAVLSLAHLWITALLGGGGAAVRRAAWPVAVELPSVSSKQESLDAYFRRLRLGTKASVIVVLSAQDPRVLEQVEFYRRLAAVPGMDGKGGRLILFARDGVVPATEALWTKSFKAHVAGSYPEESGDLPTVIGSVAVLDATGSVLRKWSGFPSLEQQEEIVRVLERALR